MPILLKIRWVFKEGRKEDFVKNQEILMQVMADDHPGVIMYHATYDTDNSSVWTELYANNEVFRAHLANEKGKEPLGALVDASEKITCECFGDPDEESKGILAGFGATYESTAKNAFLLNPLADPKSNV